MSTRSLFKRRALTLFFIVSLLPAVTVSVLWYALASGSDRTFIEFGNQFIAPVSVLGLIPAVALSLLFAELLTQPIKRLHRAINQIASGNLSFRIESENGEFDEMAQGLNSIAVDLQQIMSELKGENDLILAERNKLQVILDSMQDGVIALDHTDHVLLINKAAIGLTGHSIDQIASQARHEVLSFARGGKSGIVHEWINKQSDDKRVAKEWKSLELLRPDGQTLYVDLQAVVVPRDPNGIRSIITFHDVTKSRQLEEMKIDFVALAAHELRTPLTNIKGNLDNLDSEIGRKMDPTHYAFLSRSIASAEQLSGLVNNLLNVSRIERGELNYQLAPTDWGSFVKTVCKDLEKLAKDQGRSLKLSIDGKLPRVAADSLSITEVINNLVGNAINHTASGDILIETKAENGNVITTVTDHGDGIPPDAIPKLFTKFYQVEGLKHGHGTGLGLYISKAIVEAHQGYVWVESRVGHGSTFGFSLPSYKAIATKLKKDDNRKGALIRGTHGWIKKHTNH